MFVLKEHDGCVDSIRYSFSTNSIKKNSAIAGFLLSPWNKQASQPISQSARDRCWANIKVALVVDDRHFFF